MKNYFQFLLSSFWQQKLIYIFTLSDFFLYSYDSNTNICELANVTALQDLQHTEERKRIYIDVDTFHLVSMNCTGGRGCCSKQYSKGIIITI